VRFVDHQQGERYEERYYQDEEFGEFSNRQGDFEQEIHEDQVESLEQIDWRNQEQIEGRN
jgi:hypothetical protein